MWNLKNNTNECHSKTDSHTQKTNQWFSAGRGKEEEQVGVWDLKIQTTTCKTDKQQAHVVQHRELQPLSNITFMSIICKNTESLWCICETNIIL